MAKFFGGFVTGIFFVLAVGGLLLLTVSWMQSRPPSVADGSTVFLELEGSLPERAPVDIPLPWAREKQPLTMLDAWTVIHKAAIDKRVRALVLEPQGLTAGWGKLEELRSSILAFKKSGKPVFAYLRHPGTHDYYAAAAADKIFMLPEDELDMKGLRAELTYFKGTLDKVGVSMEFEAMGRYKDAPDEFTKTGPTPETLEVTNQILDRYYGDLLAVIANSRKKSLEDTKAIVDRGPFVSSEAKQEGLVDDLLYEDQFKDRLSHEISGGLKKANAASYRSTSVTGWTGKTRIAFIAADGEITGAVNPFSDDGISAGDMSKTLRQVRDDDSIKGAILRIDSPGGDSFASDEIWHEARLLSAKKPVVISFSDLAASGGYYIAMTGDPIVSYGNTLTGSIGVFYGRPNLRGLYDKIGLRKELLTRGKFAAIDSEYAPLTPVERAKLRGEIEKTYTGFKQRVADARKAQVKDVEPIAQGRVWLGTQAKENGLIDETGGIDRALELLKSRIHAESLSIVAYPARKTIWEVLFPPPGTNDSLELKALELKAVAKFLPRLPFTSLLNGGMLSVTPWRLEVR